MIGGVDKALGQGVKVEVGACVEEDIGKIFSGEVAGETVGGEQVEVAGVGGEGVDFGFDLRLGADGAGNDVAHGVMEGLSGGDLAGAKLLLDQGVVLGEGSEGAVAEEVAAAIAYVGEGEAGGFEQEGDEGGTHAAELGVAAGMLVDGVVGGMDGGFEAGGWVG